MNTPELKLPPHSNEAEQSLIGGLLLDNRAWDRIADIVAESDFYRDDHRRLFGHIRALIEAGKPADVVTVFAAIEKRNEVDQTGGMAYLGEIANATPSAANARRYAEIVADHALRRRLIMAAGQMESLAYQPGSALAAVDAAQELLTPLADVGLSDEPRPLSEVLGRAIDEIQARFESGAEVAGLPTGFRDIDQKLGGLQPGDLIIIAGRPSMGKSAIALNIADHVGVSERKPVVVFSLEMPDVALATRSIAAQGSVPAEGLRTGKLGDEHWDGITASLARLHEAPIWIDPSTALSVGQMHARCRRIARRQKVGIGLVVIDYLQLMHGEGANRNEEISGITRRLKLMAKDLGCPVIALSQLSRKVEERVNHRPMMSDLRDSGSIEQDADVILMMYREAYYNPESAYTGLAEVIIAKNRMGATGTVALVFQPEYSRFKDADQSAIAEAKRRAATTNGARQGRRGFE
jgi:replicative DNA helicase